jgi:hypothetical protein
VVRFHQPAEELFSQSTPHLPDLPGTQLRQGTFQGLGFQRLFQDGSPMARRVIGRQFNEAGPMQLEY